MNAPVEKEKRKRKKRPSKGLRKHNRRVKQENRRAHIPSSSTDGKKKPS